MADLSQYKANAVAEAPTVPAELSQGYPANQEAPTPATQAGGYWHYQIQEEFRNLIEGAGLTKDHTALNQVLLAVQAIAAGGNTKVVDSLVQRFSNVIIGTTLMVFDDTVPQKTEGNEFMTLAYTPNAIGNKLFIDVLVNLQSSTNSNPMAAALFKDSEASAIASGVAYSVYNNSPEQIQMHADITVADLNEITFSVNGGCGNASTCSFNGLGSSRWHGGVLNSFILIREEVA